MTDHSGDYLVKQAHRLVQNCEHSRTLLCVVLDWSDRGLYDPVDDLYAMRLSGDVVRAIRQLMEPDPAPEEDPGS